MLKKFALALTGLAFCGSAHAALIEAPLPSNAYITQNGLDWAWAFPLAASDSNFDLSFQSGFGWRIPTLEELSLAPLATDFIFAGANVPLGGTDPVSGATFAAVNAALDGDAACATPYFSLLYLHCDWGDGLGQGVTTWAGMDGSVSLSDQLVVRGSLQVEPPAQVAAPGVLGVLGMGLAGIALSRRRRRT